MQRRSIVPTFGHIRSEISPTQATIGAGGESYAIVTTAAEPWPLASAVPAAVTRQDAEPPALLVSTFRLHYVGLCRLAYLIVGDSSTAEDVVQEAFLRTFAGWRRLREVHLVHLYLRKAVINLSRSRLRNRGTELRANALFSTRNRTHSEPADWESATEVVKAMRRLPERQRLTVLLKYYLDLPEAEIAATLGTTVGTVKSQLSKARQNLHRTLAVPVDD